ncbi:MAG: carcinine hydrolase/isopenicillin-N N-acyltransferase family protein [Candidatus Gottesmanbacteria bacterium]
MCTLAAKQLTTNGWFLIKTRDPVPWMRWEDEIKLFNTPADKLKKFIIQNPNPKEDGYYGGINEKGVAFISSYVPVVENQISYIRRPYVRLILDATTAKEAVEIIKSFNPRIGGNMFIADQNECYGIEGAPDKYFIEQISSPSVKTNHYIHLPYENLEFKDSQSFKEWSYTHYQRAEELITQADTIDDLKNILKDRKNAEKKTAICTIKEEEECCTYSAFIFDTKNKKVLYSQGNPLTTPFKEYSF